MGLAHSPRIVTDGLVLCLDAANPKSYPGSGTTWTDLSGNGNNATLINGVDYINDNNGVLVFDGGNDYATVPGSTDWAFGQNGTIEQWVYITGSNGNNRFWSTTNNSSSLDAYLNRSGYSIGFHGSRAFTTTSIGVNSWTHFLVTYTAGEIRVYFNGVEQPLTGTTTGYNITNAGTLFIARFTSAPYELFARMGSMKIYNKSLSAAEIQQNFNALRGRYGI